MNEASSLEFLRSHKEIKPHLRELAWTFVEGYHAAHADRISAMALRSSDEEQEQETAARNEQFRIASGYDRVMQWLHDGISPQSEVRTLRNPARKICG